MPEMTGVMVGEGEKTFHDLLEFYIDGKDSLEEISELHTELVIRSFITAGGN